MKMCIEQPLRSLSTETANEICRKHQEQADGSCEYCPLQVEQHNPKIFCGKTLVELLNRRIVIEELGDTDVKED